MVYQITQIHLSTSFATSLLPEQIEEIKLQGGTVETVAQVAYFINLGCKYFYISPDGIPCYVEAVPSSQAAPSHIRSVHHTETIDNLCKLPLF